MPLLLDGKVRAPARPGPKMLLDGRVRAPARPGPKMLETAAITDVDQTSDNRGRCGRYQSALTAPVIRLGSGRAGARTLPDLDYYKVSDPFSSLEGLLVGSSCKNLFRRYNHDSS